LRRLEEVVERAVERALARARSEELKEVAEAIKALADYIKAFVEIEKRRWEENNRRFEALESELRKLREDFNRFVEEEMKRWEENNRKWEENYKRWEENDRLWQENFKRWEENNRRWEENYRRWEENSKLWEENFRRWRENDKRWEENMRRWEENDRRWRENEKRWEKIFEFVEEQLKFNRWVERALMEIRESLGGAYEYYTAHWIELYLAEKGYKCRTLVNLTLPIDGEKEIDVLCKDPLVVGEATVSIKSVDDAEKKLAKLLEAVEAAEKFYKRKAFMKVLAVENAPEEVVEYLRKRAEELGILLVIGREY